MTNCFLCYFDLFQAILLYCISVFICQDNQRVKFMAYTCGLDSLPVRFKINFLEPCWVCAPPWNAIPSVLLVFVQIPFLLIVYKFVLRRGVFNCIQGIFQPYFLLQFYLLFYSILMSSRNYNFYTFRYFIESSKVCKKPRYNSLRNKCLVFDIY